MPQAIEVFVVFSLRLSVLFGRNHDLHTRILSQANYLVAVIAFVRNQIVCIYSFNKLASLGTIRCGTSCNKYSDRIAMRIHGQMYL
jgi:hypothetical protein